jgi:predicted Zn-dependent protease
MRIRLAIILTITLFVPGVSAQTAFPTWHPPDERKSLTLLAPKPIGGNNIFKGEKEVWLSDALEELEGGVFDEIDDKQISEYVSRLGTYLGLHSAKSKRTYTFVVTSSSTPDAMTSGAGRVYITEGMLRLVNSEDELAGIIAHEISHDVFAHIPKTITRQLFWMNHTKKVVSPVDVRNQLERLVQEYGEQPVAAIGEQLLGFSRFGELEADRSAFYVTYKAGYNPISLSTVLKRYDKQLREESDTSSLALRLYQLTLGSHPPVPQRSFALRSKHCL